MVCCLLGTKIRDITERVTKLIKSIDYYPFLLFHVGLNDTANQKLSKIKKDYKALGVKKTVAQIVFSTILPAGEKGAARTRCRMHINVCLHGWCHHEGFGFYDIGTFFNEYNLLEGDEIHCLW